MTAPCMCETPRSSNKVGADVPDSWYVKSMGEAMAAADPPDDPQGRAAAPGHAPRAGEQHPAAADVPTVLFPAKDAETV